MLKKIGTLQRTNIQMKHYAANMRLKGVMYPPIFYSFLLYKADDMLSVVHGSLYVYGFNLSLFFYTHYCVYNCQDEANLLNCVILRVMLFHSFLELSWSKLYSKSFLF